MDQAQRLDELIVAAEERGYGKGYERGRMDGLLHNVVGKQAAEQAGFLRGFVASADVDRDDTAQAYRVLLADAYSLLSQAAENDALLDQPTVKQWETRLRLVLETGAYPGLTTKLLEAAEEASGPVFDPPGEIHVNEDQPACYLLWDNERDMWWKPNANGYTHSVAQAGLYSRDEAVKWALQGALGGLSHATVIVADGAA